MQAIRIEGANTRIDEPPGWNDEHRTVTCEPLWVRVEQDADGAIVLASAWWPNPEELAALQRGVPVVLRVWGNGHPPVCVSVDDTFPRSESDGNHDD
jgi:hypothetical protein